MDQASLPNFLISLTGISGPLAIQCCVSTSGERVRKPCVSINHDTAVRTSHNLIDAWVGYRNCGGTSGVMAFHASLRSPVIRSRLARRCSRDIRLTSKT